MCLGVFSVLVLVGPVMLLVAAVLSLSAHGVLGWLAALLLVVTVLAVTVWSGRAVLRWWRRLGPTPAGERAVGSAHESRPDHRVRRA